MDSEEYVLVKKADLEVLTKAVQAGFNAINERLDAALTAPTVRHLPRTVVRQLVRNEISRPPVSQRA